MFHVPLPTVNAGLVQLPRDCCSGRSTVAGPLAAEDVVVDVVVDVAPAPLALVDVDVAPWLDVPPVATDVEVAEVDPAPLLAPAGGGS